MPTLSARSRRVNSARPCSCARSQATWRISARVASRRSATLSRLGKSNTIRRMHLRPGSCQEGQTCSGIPGVLTLTGQNEAGGNTGVTTAIRGRQHVRVGPARTDRRTTDGGRRQLLRGGASASPTASSRSTIGARPAAGLSVGALPTDVR